MARYLLDSNAFLNFKDDPARLRPEAREAIENPGNQLYVSLASLWELAIKAANGKLPFYTSLIAGGANKLTASLQESGFELLLIGVQHALIAAALPQYHRDPFDRMLIAQAIDEDMVLISSDRICQLYRGLKLMAA